MAGKTISFVLGRGNMNHNNRKFYTENVDPERTHLNKSYVVQPLKAAYKECSGRHWITIMRSRKGKTGEKMIIYLR